MERALIFDTETTGLIANSLVAERNQPRVIEFFGHIVHPDTGEIADELEFLCDPGIPLTAEITRITGIKPEDVAGRPRFAEFQPRVAELIASADAVVAHNLSYDWQMLNIEFMRCQAEASWPKVRICTVEETEWLKGYRLGLSALHEELFGEAFKGAHRARQDVEALTRCFLELRKRGYV